MITKKRWFKAKEYGWGWYPVSWQGWAVTILYTLFIIWSFRRIDNYSNSAKDTLINFIPEIFLATALLIGICYLTGDKAGWRWGEDKDNTKNGRL